MRTNHARRVSVDKRLDEVQKKSESRAYQTLHEKQLLELFTPHFNLELSHKLLNGTASALRAAISYHQCMNMIGQTIDSEGLEASKRFSDSIRSHRRRLESFDHWIVVSEAHAASVAKKLDLGDDHVVVLASDVVGSEALWRRDVNAVCGFSEQLIPIEDARVCACGVVIAQKHRLTQAVVRFGHCCTIRTKLARSVVARMTRCLPQFPFTVLCDANGRVLGPVHIGSAISLVHHNGVLPLIPITNEDDIVFLKRNASLCLRIMDFESDEWRAGSHAVHLCPPR
jgi:hypothetical protein